jgi:hypothetical protein
MIVAAAKPLCWFTVRGYNGSRMGANSLRNEGDSKYLALPTQLREIGCK